MFIFELSNKFTRYTCGCRLSMREGAIVLFDHDAPNASLYASLHETRRKELTVPVTLGTFYDL